MLDRFITNHLQKYSDFRTENHFADLARTKVQYLISDQITDQYVFARRQADHGDQVGVLNAPNIQYRIQDQGDQTRED